MADRLNPNESLPINSSITSQDGRFTLNMQGDGNLVLYGPSGKYRWDSATHGQSVTQTVMQGDGNFVIYGPGGALWASGTHGHSGAWLVVQNDGNLVIYDPSGSALWATGTYIHCANVPGFLPSTSGFHFSNSFPAVPHFTIDILGQQIPIGNAANGLCGGMAFAARDYFEARVLIPSETTSPSSGPVFDYLVRRLYDSFNLFLPPPFGPGPLTYMHLMNPDLPDHETWFSNAGLAPRGRAWVMIINEWPKIRADIDSGHPSPIGLIRIKSRNPFEMGQNHQVLAYGYCLDGTDLTIQIYDSNYPNDDNVTLSLNIGDPQHTTPVSYSKGGDVWCFFQPVYALANPPVPKGKEKDKEKEKDRKEGKEKDKEFAKRENKEIPKEKERDFEPFVKTKEIAEGSFSAQGGQASLEERLARLEATIGQLSHFIKPELRPDLSVSSLKREPDAGGPNLATLRQQLQKRAADAKQSKDNKDLEKLKEK